MHTSTIKFKSKPTPETIDDLELIEQVKMREFLYKLKHPDYRNLPRRNEAWAEIAAAMRIKDPQTIALRWKAVREKFAVKYRKYYFDQIEPTWEHFSICNFLIPYVNLVSTRKSQKDSDSSSDQTSQEPAALPMMHVRFEESHLVELIHERPVIYDQQHENFKVKSARLEAWKDISSKTGWDCNFMQKRWRVMRDRFVREVRKSNNSVQTTNSSSYFTHMLFLLPHIKSKNYSLEAEYDEYNNEDDSTYGHENFDMTSNGSLPEVVVEEEEVEQEIVQHENIEEFDENNCYRSYEEAELLEEMHDDHNMVTTEEDNEYSDEENQIETVVFEDDEQYLSSVSYQQDCDEITKEETEVTPAVVSRKRKHSSAIEEAPAAVKNESEVTRPATIVSHDINLALTDEDLAFGQTIGLMLKKIPNKLKTSIKLKILGCIDDFELLHDLK